VTKGQWYPGSMSKAVDQLRQDLKSVDLVFELLDARIPKSSRNPIFSELLQNKKHLVLLHKADRAEDEITERWRLFYESEDKKAMAFSVKKKTYINQLLGYLKNQKHNMPPARIKRPLRMMFVGIPNVGKSTVINLFVHKSVAKTGNQPGITKGRQWIKIMPGMELLDTPGILWPKINDDTIQPLSAVGALPVGQIDRQENALWLLNQYVNQGKVHLLLKRYPALQIAEPEQIFEQLGISQGCLQSEGKLDLERTAAILLRDFQNGSLGRITLEEPPNIIK